ncbi:uncharacterized protein LOC127027376 isoform X2 [Gymnogyps californianus]|uniref:uncharacterized protein LOC127027376 isoform X2 n=1 Tax=Gymnogyps californianus TaxID=33616 RepID=UPI0021C84C88|nr:uncharacterized protein LOC127027376 isoform X2 [Gymnogyps californianus]
MAPSMGHETTAWNVRQQGLQLDEYISGGAERPGSQSPNKDHGPRWVPARCVQPALTKLPVPGKQQTTAKDPEGPAETSEDILSDSANCFDGK